MSTWSAHHHIWNLVCSWRTDYCWKDIYTNCKAVRQGVAFLLNKQGEDRGWGESYLSSPLKAERDPIPLHKAAKLLTNSQMENGDFPQQEVTGAFNKNCLLHFAAYRMLLVSVGVVVSSYGLQNSYTFFR